MKHIKLKKNTHYTYLLIDPRNCLPFYIGKGVNNRVYSHINDNYTKSYNPIKTNKINSIISDGHEIEFAIIYQPSEPDAYEAEAKLINYYGRVDNKTGILTNLNEGGKGGNTGFKMTPEMIEKLKGRKKGIKTPEGIERIRRAVSGPKSVEHKKKLQANCPKAKPVIQFDKCGNFINQYVSAREAMKQTGVDNAQISRCCTGHYKSAGGYVWIYKSEFDSQGKIIQSPSAGIFCQQNSG